MLQVIVTIILYPYLSVLWYYFSYVGVLFIALFLIGYLIHNFFPVKRERFIKKQFDSLQYTQKAAEINRIGVTSRAKFNAKVAFGELMEDLIKFHFRRNVYSQKALELLLNPEASDNSKVTISTKIQGFVQLLKDKLHSLQSQSLSESVLTASVHLLERFVVSYKELCAEIQMRNPKEHFEHRHLDEFNDFSFDNDDEGIKWSVELDKIHQQMQLRLKYSGKLHCGIGNGKEAELMQLRKYTSKIMDLMADAGFPITPSKSLRILIREWVVCKLAWPILNRITHPDIINKYIATKANERIMIQKTVKTFRAKLDFEHESFPPAFLILNYQPKVYSLAEKMRYLDVISRYLRKANSIVDVSAVKHELAYDIKAKYEQIGILYEFMQQNWKKMECMRMKLKYIEDISDQRKQLYARSKKG
jgi:hypothetical protein